MIDAAQQRIIALENKIGQDAKSPLFAQLANYYLEASRAEDALRMCDSGLANFPFFTTGHLVKGKALIALNMKAEARREFEFVLEFLPNNEAVARLLEQIPPGEEELLAPLQQSAQPEETDIESTQPAAPEYDYIIPSTPQAPLRTETSYSVDTSIGEPVVSEIEQVLPPEVEAPGETNFFDAVTQTPPAVAAEDPFGFGFHTPSVETPVTPEQVSSPFLGFDTPTPSPASFTETPEISSTFIGLDSPTTAQETFPEIQAPPTEPYNKFNFSLTSSDLDHSIPVAPVEEEPFENFVLRRKPELSGKGIISLDDYLNNVPASLPQVEPPSLSPAVSPVIDISTGMQNDIEEIANKLQTAKKIIPVINLAQKETPTESEKDTPTSIGFVTPTLAEIYAKQGWFDDAIKAYRTLARNKPAEKERYEKRIAELEEIKNKNS
jgi:tetratricopeptide (TPR) repeat protein